ncbi:MAG: hypothetical protein NT062_31575 [Proteobacteria bacterium]|nr:hypothetical protein [Pseudomonadota bacterium]
MRRLTLIIVVVVLVVVVTGGGCAIDPDRPVGHPASPTAPIGRLAPAPPSLRPGVVAYPDVPLVRAAPEHHHHKQTP